jgi:hypothetical protein
MSRDALKQLLPVGHYALIVLLWEGNSDVAIARAIIAK